jgi:putative transposase
MTNKTTSHHRRSIRLKEYDYTTTGYYYITICSHDHQCLFGEVKNGKMTLNHTGQIVETEWNKTPDIRSNISLDEFVIMPNHLRAIVIIDNTVGAHRNVPLLSKSPTFEQFGKSTPNSIPTIVKLFNSTVTKQINILRNTPAQPVWQRNYFERVIRNDKKLFNIRQYIINNPLKWELDNDNPINWKIQNDRKNN